MAPSQGPLACWLTNPASHHVGCLGQQGELGLRAVSSHGSELERGKGAPWQSPQTGMWWAPGPARPHFTAPHIPYRKLLVHLGLGGCGEGSRGVAPSTQPTL